jgi:hypothetical protein
MMMAPMRFPVRIALQEFLVFQCGQFRGIPLS